jgi:hypothetical protein
MLSGAAVSFVNMGSAFGLVGSLFRAALGFGNLTIQFLLGAAHLFLHAFVHPIAGLSGTLGNAFLLIGG